METRNQNQTNQGRGNNVAGQENKDTKLQKGEQKSTGATSPNESLKDAQKRGSTQTTNASQKSQGSSSPSSSKTGQQTKIDKTTSQNGRSEDLDESNEDDELSLRSKKSKGK